MSEPDGQAVPDADLPPQSPTSTQEVPETYAPTPSTLSGHSGPRTVAADNYLRCRVTAVGDAQ